MRRCKLIQMLLSLAVMVTLLTGTAQAALLDFGPIVPEVVGSTPPNLRTGFPAWFRDTNRVPLQLCLEEVPGCLFAAVDRPNLLQPLAFPNIPDELFYYSATAVIGDQLLFAGVEMNFFDNGDGTYQQIGFTRVRIRIDSNIAGRYTVTTPWKQYFFNVDQATITANAGRKVINATEDIGLGPDGVFAGALAGTIGPYVYSQGAPFVTATGSYLGDSAFRTVLGSTFPDPGNPGQMANIFRIEGPPGFTTVSTNQFAITGKLYLDPIPTPLTVDRATYALNANGMQIDTFATTQAFSNQTVGGSAIPGQFALSNVPSALQITGTGITMKDLETNSPVDGKFFATGITLPAPETTPASITFTNTADTPDTVKTVPLVDEVVIDSAIYNPLTKILSITAASLDEVAPPVLQAFMPGMILPLGTISGGLLAIEFPFTDTSVPKTYNIPPLSVKVTSSKGGSATVPVSITTANTSAPLSISVPTSSVTGSYNISWAASTTPGSTYILQEATSPDFLQNLVETVGATSPVAYTGKASGTYYYRVKAQAAGFFDSGWTSGVNGCVVAVPANSVSLIPRVTSPQLINSSIIFDALVVGGDAGPYEYRFRYRSAVAGTPYIIAQDYSTETTFTWNTAALGLPAGTYNIVVDVRHVGSTNFEAQNILYYTLNTIVVPATSVSLVPRVSSPQPVNTSIIFDALAAGGDAGPYQYQFRYRIAVAGVAYTMGQPYSASTSYTWDTAALALPAGTYNMLVETRHVGGKLETQKLITFTLTP
ncbi:MAG: transcription factor [Geobacteraceae bacterium]|nr:transcription factor [Geobacteraceae bacterium]